MLTRREFLSQAAGATVTLLLTPIVAACSSSSSNGTATSMNPTLPGCDGVGETSTVVESHTHAICVPAADLSSPPANGMTYPTTTTLEHMHEVTLSQAQLQAIEGGQTVTVTTSVTNAHEHGFTISKATTTPAPTTTTSPPPPPGTGGY